MQTALAEDEFVGTPVLFDLESIRIPARRSFQRLFASPLEQTSFCPPIPRPFFRQEELIVFAGRDPALLLALVRRFSPSARHNARETLRRDPPPIAAMHGNALARFHRAQLDLLPARSRASATKREAIRRLLSNGRAAQLFRRFEFAAEVALLRIRKRFSLRETARRLGVHLNQVAHVWTAISRSKGQHVVALRDRALEAAAAARFLEVFFEARVNDAEFLGRSLLVNFREAAALLPGNERLSFRAFYEAARSFGLRFRAIRYGPRPAKTIRPAQLKAFTRLLVLLCCDKRRFHVIFLDESAICPSNFQKRQWRARGQSNITASRMRYEKLEVLGALSTEGIIATQIVVAGFSGKVFTAFAAKAIRRAQTNLQPNQQLVVLLDNASRHMSAELFAFCRSNQVVLLFNIPHFCAANPIEYAWEFTKRPFRSWRDYRR